ncbi:hypothetical protein [Micromonospora sp. NPDC005367]|uniref:hypothetical protein n=1 Tax=Micromonospora sp. NPDC005367 TaxID=3155590 RepID=UPI0033BE399D
MLLALGAGALITALSTNGMIGQTAKAIFIIPCVLVFLMSAFVSVVTLAIGAAGFSRTPIGSGSIQRQARFTSMFLVDLLTLRLLARRNPGG